MRVTVITVEDADGVMIVPANYRPVVRDAIELLKGAQRAGLDYAATAHILGAAAQHLGLNK